MKYICITLKEGCVLLMYFSLIIFHERNTFLAQDFKILFCKNASKDLSVYYVYFLWNKRNILLNYCNVSNKIINFTYKKCTNRDMYFNLIFVYINMIHKVNII